MIMNLCCFPICVKGGLTIREDGRFFNLTPSPISIPSTLIIVIFSFLSFFFFFLAVMHVGS